MSKMRGVALAACLLGLLLAGCSRPAPPSPVLTTPAPAASTPAGAEEGKGKNTKTPDDPNLAYTNASNACRQKATKTTMGSILAIFTRLRPGAYDADYKACMKTAGYDVSQ